MLTLDVVDRLFAMVDSCPWGKTAAAGSAKGRLAARPGSNGVPLYTPDQRRRRDATPWTVVQGVLAPLQFLVFLISLALVLRFLVTGTGEQAAVWSIITKTGVLCTIMVTGAIWERVVFGRYLFAPAFFWEDVFSILVIALHGLYVALLLAGTGSAEARMYVALAAYGAYLINAAQFLMKLRAARLGAPSGLGLEAGR